MARNLSDIAKDIRANWKNISIGAEPYLQAMEEIHSSEPDASTFFEKGDTLVFENAKTLSMYFLFTAYSWRGEAAKRIKSELKKQYKLE